jgi:hypothetical protein
VASVYTSGLGALSLAPGGESLEFLAAYLVGRGFFFGPAALDTFIRVLMVVTITTVILAMADSISGRLIVHETIAAIVHAPRWPQPGYRYNMVRAVSTFDQEILFGAFCALVSPVFLYWDRSVLQRTLCVGICFIGCILSLSSAALMSLSIVLTAYTYDRLMRQYLWRWKAFCMLLGALIAVLFTVSNHPIGWIVKHLTLDPETGYYRILLWNQAFDAIALSPLVGFPIKMVYHSNLDGTLDSVWLVEALRFGVPIIIFLFLTNVTAFSPTGQSFKIRAGDFDVVQMGLAFTIVLVMFMFSGLTTHWWGYLWTFWGLCIGIRASLRERSIEMASRPAPLYRREPVPTCS